MNHVPSILFSSASPEGNTEEKFTTKFKRAMIAEGALIASNVKIFLAVLGVVGIAAADMAVEPKSLEDWGLKGCLLVAILILARVIATQNRKIESLYERLAEKDDDADSGGHPRRHRK